MSFPTEPTPKERLSASRKAIVRNMTRDSQASEEQYSHEFDENEPARPASGGSWGLVKHAIRAWWRNHPVNLALDLARPVIGKYAEEKPLKLLGIAAGIGAAAVVLRPWRLVSLSALLVAALKSSELSSVLLSMLSTPLQDSKKPSTAL